MRNRLHFTSILALFPLIEPHLSSEARKSIKKLRSMSLNRYFEKFSRYLDRVNLWNDRFTNRIVSAEDCPVKSFPLRYLFRAAYSSMRRSKTCKTVEFRSLCIVRVQIMYKPNTQNIAILILKERLVVR